MLQLICYSCRGRLAGSCSWGMWVDQVQATEVTAILVSVGSPWGSKLCCWSSMFPMLGALPYLLIKSCSLEINSVIDASISGLGVIARRSTLSSMPPVPVWCVYILLHDCLRNLMLPKCCCPNVCSQLEAARAPISAQIEDKLFPNVRYKH